MIELFIYSSNAVQKFRNIILAFADATDCVPKRFPGNGKEARLRMLIVSIYKSKNTARKMFENNCRLEVNHKP